MKHFILAALFTLVTSTTALAQNEKQDVPKIVAIVTSETPQIQLMSMVLTVQAVQRGVDVHVLLCGVAGDMALRDAPEAVTAGQPPLNISPQAFMNILLQNEGATVEVCALYLPGKGVQPTDLLDNIGVASPGDMSQLMTDPSVRVVTF